MNFPRSIPFNSGCPYSHLNPRHFESLVQASREPRCPTQISDPDMFITFHSPTCTQEAQSPADLGGLSPRSEDSLERTIKKLKLNTDESPEYRLFQQETQSILSDFQPWGNFQFETSQGVSTIEGTAGNAGLGSSLSGNSPQCPMFEKMRVSAENEGEKKPIEAEEDDEIIFLDSKPGNVGQNNQNNKVSDSKPSPCLRHLILDKKDSETMKLHKGAKTVHEVKMLGEHENLLWQSFVKVHSHIPGFPVNDTEHLDYITMILRHKAKHLFNIGKQQVKDLSKPGPESRQTACPTVTSSKPSSDENGTPEDPRQVFNNPYHKQLLEKCPIMHDFFQKENPPKTNTNPAPTPAPVIQIQPQPQTQAHPPLTPVQNPHILPAHCTNMPNPHTRMPVVPNTQQPLMPNTIIGDRSHAIHLLNSWFGMGFNHFVQAQNNPAMAGCPMHMMMGGGAGNKQPPGRERRGAFKAALTKMKGGSNRK